MQLSTQDRKFSGLVLLFLGLALGGIAQATLMFSVQDGNEYFIVSNWWENTWSNSSPIAGIFLYGLATVFFILGMRELDDLQVPMPVHVDRHAPYKPKFGFWITSLGLSAGIVYFLVSMGQDNPASYVLAAVWALSIILFVASVLLDVGWRAPSFNEVKEWFLAQRIELLVMATILIAAFVIRFVDLELHPYSFINDEGKFGKIGLCVLYDDCRNIFSMEGWSGQALLNFWPYGLSILVFGKTALAMRIISAVIGTVSTLALYLFAREVFDRKVAWVSAFLLVTLPVHVQFSRLGVDNIVVSALAPLLLWLLFRGIKSGSVPSFLAAGLLAGLCAYTYPGALIVPLLGAGVLFYLAIQKRGFLVANSRNILFFILAAVIVVLPLLGNYYNHPDLFLGRLRGEGIFANGSLEEEMASTGTSAAEILARQFARSSLVYLATPALEGFFRSPQPYLTALEAVLFVMGLALTIWRIKDARFMLLFIWFWTPIILGSTLTASPPSTQRMLMSMPAMVIIIAIGAVKTLDALRHISKKVLPFIPVILLGLVIYTGFVNLSFYFGEYRSGYFFEERANEFTYETRGDIAALGSNGRLYLITDPGILYLSFPNFDYFAANVERNDFNTISAQALDELPDDQDALFIASSEYEAEIKQITQWIPDGVWKEVKRYNHPEEPLYYSYKITKEQLEGFKP